MKTCWWIFHEWSMWRLVEVQISVFFMKPEPSVRQMRECGKCGLQQMKHLD